MNNEIDLSKLSSLQVTSLVAIIPDTPIVSIAGGTLSEITTTTTSTKTTPTPITLETKQRAAASSATSTATDTGGDTTTIQKQQTKVKIKPTHDNSNITFNSNNSNDESMSDVKENENSTSGMSSATAIVAIQAETQETLGGSNVADIDEMDDDACVSNNNSNNKNNDSNGSVLKAPLITAAIDKAVHVVSNIADPVREAANEMTLITTATSTTVTTTMTPAAATTITTAATTYTTNRSATTNVKGASSNSSTTNTTDILSIKTSEQLTATTSTATVLSNSSLAVTSTATATTITVTATSSTGAVQKQQQQRQTKAKAQDDQNVGKKKAKAESDSWEDGHLNNLSDLNDIDLKGLLEEAYLYRNPGDKKNKSGLFLQMLKKAESEDEEVYSLQAITSHYTRQQHQQTSIGASTQAAVGLTTATLPSTTATALSTSEYRDLHYLAQLARGPLLPEQQQQHQHIQQQQHQHHIYTSSHHYNNSHHHSHNHHHHRRKRSGSLQDLVESVRRSEALTDCDFSNTANNNGNSNNATGRNRHRHQTHATNNSNSSATTNAAAVSMTMNSKRKFINTANSAATVSTRQRNGGSLPTNENAANFGVTLTTANTTISTANANGGNKSAGLLCDRTDKLHFDLKINQAHGASNSTDLVVTASSAMAGHSNNNISVTDNSGAGVDECNNRRNNSNCNSGNGNGGNSITTNSRHNFGGILMNKNYDLNNMLLNKKGNRRLYKNHELEKTDDNATCAAATLTNLATADAISELIHAKTAKAADAAQGADDRIINMGGAIFDIAAQRSKADANLSERFERNRRATSVNERHAANVVDDSVRFPSLDQDKNGLNNKILESNYLPFDDNYPSCKSLLGDGKRDQLGDENNDEMLRERALKLSRTQSTIAGNLDGSERFDENGNNLSESCAAAETENINQITTISRSNSLGTHTSINLIGNATISSLVPSFATPIRTLDTAVGSALINSSCNSSNMRDVSNVSQSQAKPKNKKKSQQDRNTKTFNVESVAGYRGKDPIHVLVKYIESNEDKHNENINNNNSNGSNSNNNNNNNKSNKCNDNQQQKLRKERKKDKQQQQKMKKSNSLEELRSCAKMDDMVELKRTAATTESNVVMRNKQSNHANNNNNTHKNKDFNKNVHETNNKSPPSSNNNNNNSRKTERRSWGTDELQYLGESQEKNTNGKTSKKDINNKISSGINVNDDDDIVIIATETKRKRSNECIDLDPKITKSQETLLYEAAKAIEAANNSSTSTPLLSAMAEINVLNAVLSETAEFCVVTKKKRPKKQRAATMDDATAAAAASAAATGNLQRMQNFTKSANNTHMLPRTRHQQQQQPQREIQINQQQQQDYISLRKSASSMPPSEQSECSDRDSVHSLPAHTAAARKKKKANKQRHAKNVKNSNEKRTAANQNQQPKGSHYTATASKIANNTQQLAPISYADIARNKIESNALATANAAAVGLANTTSATTMIAVAANAAAITTIAATTTSTTAAGTTATTTVANGQYDIQASAVQPVIGELHSLSRGYKCAKTKTKPDFPDLIATINGNINVVEIAATTGPNKAHNATITYSQSLAAAVTMSGFAVTDEIFNTTVEQQQSPQQQHQQQASQIAETIISSLTYQKPGQAQQQILQKSKSVEHESYSYNSSNLDQQYPALEKTVKRHSANNVSVASNSNSNASNSSNTVQFNFAAVAKQVASNVNTSNASALATTTLNSITANAPTSITNSNKKFRDKQATAGTTTITAVTVAVTSATATATTTAATTGTKFRKEKQKQQEFVSRPATPTTTTTTVIASITQKITAATQTVECLSSNTGSSSNNSCSSSSKQSGCKYINGGRAAQKLYDGHHSQQYYYHCMDNNHDCAGNNSNRPAVIILNDTRNINDLPANNDLIFGDFNEDELELLKGNDNNVKVEVTQNSKCNELPKIKKQITPTDMSNSNNNSNSNTSVESATAKSNFNDSGAASDVNNSAQQVDVDMLAIPCGAANAQSSPNTSFVTMIQTNANASGSADIDDGAAAGAIIDTAATAATNTACNQSSDSGVYTATTPTTNNSNSSDNANINANSILSNSIIENIETTNSSERLLNEHAAAAVAVSVSMTTEQINNNEYEMRTAVTTIKTTAAAVTTTTTATTANNVNKFLNSTNIILNNEGNASATNAPLPQQLETCNDIETAMLAAARAAAEEKKQQQQTAIVVQDTQSTNEEKPALTNQVVIKQTAGIIKTTGDEKIIGHVDNVINIKAKSKSINEEHKLYDNERPTGSTCRYCNRKPNCNCNRRHSAIATETRPAHTVRFTHTIYPTPTIRLTHTTPGPMLHAKSKAKLKSILQNDETNRQALENYRRLNYEQERNTTNYRTMDSSYSEMVDYLQSTFNAIVNNPKTLVYREETDDN